MREGLCRFCKLVTPWRTDEVFGHLCTGCGRVPDGQAVELAEPADKEREPSEKAA